MQTEAKGSLALADRDGAAVPAALNRAGARRRPIGLWLLVLAGMVLVMVVLGGLTRLTGSGLSMVEWQPLTLLPPLGDAAWQAMFAKYQASPQYRLVNAGMDLAGFKEIFWLEYVHRLWGRLIGLAFLLPFVAFLVQGRITRADAPRLLALFALGGLEGLLGWLMVKSGLASRPEVSHYRLAAHLVTAMVIYAALLWSALDYLAERRVRAPVAKGVGTGLHLLLILIGLTIPAGALVAGLHAGLAYNDFPFMDGRLLPPDAFALSPSWLNPFENLALVQFDHRVLAIATWITAVGLWLRFRHALPSPRAQLALGLVPAAATLQAGLGIATLMLAVPVPLAAAHQAGAFLLLSAALVAYHAVKRGW